MLGTVPVTNIAAMVVTAVVTVLIPIAAFIILNKKAKCKQTCLLVGVGTFIVCALIIESIVNFAVSRLLGETLRGNIWAYALYGGLAAGLFEETGRYISMKLFMKKDLTKQNAFMYGIGYGGAEAVIVGTMTYISNIAVSVMINSGQFEPMLAELDEATKAQVIDQYSALWNLSAYEFLLAGLERASAFVLQLCFTYVIYRAVKNKKPAFYVLSVFMHFAVDAGTVLLLKKAMLPSVAVELILVAVTAVLATVIYKQYKAEKEEVPENREPLIIQ